MEYTRAQVAKRLNVAQRTISNWVAEVEDFLSESTGAQRRYTEDDLIVLATYNQLKQQRVDKDEIQQRLSDGYRVDPPDDRAIESFIDATEVRIEAETYKKERDAALERITNLETTLEEERQQRRTEQTEAMQRERDLLREIGSLQAKAAAAEAKLEATQDASEKKRGWFS